MTAGTTLMSIVALEEHFTVPDIAARIPPEAIAAWGWPSEMPPHMRHDERLADLGEGRIAEMDQSGLTAQVLSSVGPGADLLAGAEAVRFARDANDRLADAVRARPDRLAGFAHLPMSVPSAAPDELQRCVERHGFCGAMVHGRQFLDSLPVSPADKIRIAHANADVLLGLTARAA